MNKSCPRCGQPAHRQMKSPTACVNTLRGVIDTLQQEIRDRDRAAADTVDHLQQRLREVEEALRVIAAMDSAEDIEGHPTVYVEAAVDIARQALSTERTPT